MPVKHAFRYSSSAAIQVDSFTAIQTAIVIDAPAQIKVGKGFSIKVKLPIIKPMNLIPTVPANQFVSSLLLQAIAFQAANFNAITQATRMLIGDPANNPQRKRKGKRVIHKQTFQFPDHPFTAGQPVVLMVRSVQTFFEGDGLSTRKPIQKALAAINVTA
jgi:hypothetical protein